MTFNYLSQLIKQIDLSPKCPNKVSSLLQNYKGIDWNNYCQYQPTYPHQLKLWNNNAHELSLISLFPKQSCKIYKNSTVCMLTGQALTNEPFLLSLDYPNYFIKNNLQITSKNDYTSLLIFKNYKDYY